MYFARRLPIGKFLSDRFDIARLGWCDSAPLFHEMTWLVRAANICSGWQWCYIVLPLRWCSCLRICLLRAMVYSLILLSVLNIFFVMLGYVMGSR